MASMISTPDACSPKPTSVPIPADEDPNVVFWPMCVTLDQCGGCCGTEVLDCAPSIEQTVELTVSLQCTIQLYYPRLALPISHIAKCEKNSHVAKRIGLILATVAK